MTEKELVSNIVSLRKEIDIKENEREELKNKLDSLTRILIQYSKEKGIKSTAKYEGIGSITIPEPTRYYSISDEDKDRAFKFLRDNELDGFIKYDINPRTLSREMNALRESGVEIPDCIKCFEKQTIKVNKGK